MAGESEDYDGKQSLHGAERDEDYVEHACWLLFERVGCTVCCRCS